MCIFCRPGFSWCVCWNRIKHSWPCAVGNIALVLELIGLALYFAALLCSHVVAFHTEKNLKMVVLKHLAKMPMGYFDANPSGKLRKIIDDNSFQTETFIAHQLPIW